MLIQEGPQNYSGFFYYHECVYSLELSRARPAFLYTFTLIRNGNMQAMHWAYVYGVCCSMSHFRGQLLIPIPAYWYCKYDAFRYCRLTKEWEGESVKSPIDLLTLIFSLVLLLLFYREDMIYDEIYWVVNDIRYGTKSNFLVLVFVRS